MKAAKGKMIVDYYIYGSPAELKPFWVSAFAMSQKASIGTLHESDVVVKFQGQIWVVPYNVFCSKYVKIASTA